MNNNRKWLAFANEAYCDHRLAIKEKGFINWTMNVKSKFAENGTVYLFMSDKRAVNYKLKVSKVNVPREDGDYWIIEAPTDNTYQLDFVQMYEGGMLNEDVLKNVGFNGGGSILTPSCNNVRLIEYIDGVFKRNQNEDYDLEFQEKIQDEETPVTFSDTSKQEPSYTNGASGKVVAKKAYVSKQALKRANFKCAFDCCHETFLNKKGNPYMEGHHLIPCTVENSERFWDECGANIDCVENIVSLCPTCHRRVHFGSAEERTVIIKALYEKQIASLRGAGIDITIEDLLSLYDLC